MITGLLFTLAQKQPLPAHDDQASDHQSEGHHFPAAKPKKVKAPINIVRLTQIVSVILTVFGVGLLSLGSMSWSFDPAFGLNVQTAGLCFTLPVGVVS
jgi:hypothetical protein